MKMNLMKRTLYMLTLATIYSPTLNAQEEASKPQVLLKESHHGFVFAVDNKFSEINGEFANFFGIYGGWLINHQFMIGVGGYGKTTDIYDEMGYGGFVLEYYINPNRLWNVSVKGLLGAGASARSWSHPFFVAEPEVKVMLNLTEWMRLGGGLGYRFTAGEPWHNHDFGGVTASIDLKFGRF